MGETPPLDIESMEFDFAFRAQFHAWNGKQRLDFSLKI